ncbi:MAG: L-ribulose-5-phosphate 3-epimerase [Acidobacteriota bacterium]|nr:L-ribulose-5-phosphate 3-epimerase [Acidobacteriota bacterium]
MQGRLVPPVNGRIQAFPREDWFEEFPRAAAAGLDGIEWIFDCHGEGANPVETVEGLARLKQLSAEHGVSVRSLCADYFMERPLVRATEAERAERLDKLAWLLGQCASLGVGRVVLPFVDQSSMSTPEEQTIGAEVLRRSLPAAEGAGIELHLETDLDPEDFRRFLSLVEHPLVKVNYDSGNSASLGYHPRDEFAAYGPRVGSVHIKDRVRGGSTVPLSTGDTDFEALFAGLRGLGYIGEFVLQVARGADGDEVEWARQNRAFVESRWGREVESSTD